MQSAGNDQQEKRLVRWYRRRYRDRIWGVTPEMWLAISFALLVLGVSMLNAGSYVLNGSESDREFVYKVGGFLMFTGWAVFVFLIETVKSRNGYRYTFFRGTNTRPLGISISPPIQPEWLSAVLLPKIERGWVALESERWFEPGFQFPPPPTPATAEKDTEDTPVSVSKKKRNRKKKTNNQTSELGEAECSIEIPDEIEVSNEIISDEHAWESNQEDLLSQSLGKFDSNRSYASDEDALEESVRGQQKDNQTSVEDRNSGKTSDQSENSHQTSGQYRESQHVSNQQEIVKKEVRPEKEKEVKSEKSIQTSAKTTISKTVSSGGNPKVSNLTSLSNNSEKSKLTSTQSVDSSRIDNPEQAGHVSDHLTAPKVDSGKMQTIDLSVASNSNSRQSTSKKRNRRRKK